MPLSPRITSFPRLPFIISDPPSPMRISSPLPASRMSSPPPPKIKSCPVPEKTTSPPSSSESTDVAQIRFSNDFTGISAPPKTVITSSPNNNSPRSPNTIISWDQPSVSEMRSMSSPPSPKTAIIPSGSLPSSSNMPKSLPLFNHMAVISPAKVL